MATEIEAKIKVESLEVCVRRLGELGGQLQGEVVQRDYFFDRADGRLQAADCGLRLRQESHGQRQRVMMCFKGPRDKQSIYKRREEIELAVSEVGLARQLLEALGYEVTLAFEKRRSVWRVGECSVCLDEVAELGFFVEIEGPSEAAVGEVQAMLGWADAELVCDSYAAMLAGRLRESAGEEAREVFF